MLNVDRIILTRVAWGSEVMPMAVKSGRPANTLQPRVDCNKIPPPLLVLCWPQWILHHHGSENQNHQLHMKISPICSNKANNDNKSHCHLLVSEMWQSWLHTRETYYQRRTITLTKYILQNNATVPHKALQQTELRMETIVTQSIKEVKQLSIIMFIMLSVMVSIQYVK